MSLNTFVNVECSKGIFISYLYYYDQAKVVRIVTFVKKKQQTIYSYRFEWECHFNILTIYSKRKIIKYHPKFGYFGPSRAIKTERKTYRRYSKMFNEWKEYEIDAINEFFKRIFR